MIWDRWFNEPMDGDWGVLKEEKCWIWWEIYLSYPKSTLQIWLSKNEDWLALTTPSQDDEWGNGYVFGEFCQQNIGFIGVTISPWWFPVIRSWLCLYSPSAGPCSTCGEWPSARLDAWGFGMKNMKKWKKRMVLPCLGKKKAVARYVFAFWLIKDVDVDIKHVESNNENWVLYNTQGDCNRQTWSNVWIQACHLMDIYIYIYIYRD